MIRNRFGLTVIALLVALGSLSTRVKAQDGGKGAAAAARSIEGKAARPGPDFPNLESYYPAEAKRAGQQGSAILHFCVDSAGKLTEPPTIASSSGNDLLDAAAVNLATAGSGHYIPASESGVAVRGCSQFRIAFKLMGAPVLPLNDPRFPTVCARIGKLNAEFTRRMEDVVSKFGRPSPQLAITLEDPESLRAIRQYARALDSALDESVGLTADFLEDVDYLARSPDIPETERSTFGSVWPDQRAAIAARFREMLGATRDIVRLIDELGDYVSFRVPRRSNADAGVESQTLEQDPQIIAIKERARNAIDRLRATTEAMGKGSPAGVH